MGIVNPDDAWKSMMKSQKTFWNWIEDVILDPKENDATERLLDYSEKVKSVKKEKNRRLILARTAFAGTHHLFTSKRCG